MAFMPQYAPFVVLGFLGACFALGVLGLGMVYGLARRKFLVAKLALGAALAGVGVYAALLLAGYSVARARAMANAFLSTRVAVGVRV